MENNKDNSNYTSYENEIEPIIKQKRPSFGSISIEHHKSRRNLSKSDDTDDTNITFALQTKLLEDYIDRCYIMTIMCDQCSNYYTRLKYMFQVPIIISSSTMTIVNSNTNIKNNYIVNIFNITINVLITVLIALQSTFMITEKAYQFKLNAAKFSKLEHFIENKIISLTPTTEFIENITLQYGSHMDDIDYVIPEYIKRDMRIKFEGKRRLPFMININEHNEHNEANETKCKYYVNADFVGISNNTLS